MSRARALRWSSARMVSSLRSQPAMASQPPPPCRPVLPRSSFSTQPTLSILPRLQPRLWLRHPCRHRHPRRPCHRQSRRRLAGRCRSPLPQPRLPPPCRRRMPCLLLVSWTASRTRALSRAACRSWCPPPTAQARAAPAPWGTWGVVQAGNSSWFAQSRRGGVATPAAQPAWSSQHSRVRGAVSRCAASASPRRWVPRRPGSRPRLRPPLAWRLAPASISPANLAAPLARASLTRISLFPCCAGRTPRGMCRTTLRAHVLPSRRSSIPSELSIPPPAITPI